VPRGGYIIRSPTRAVGGSTWSIVGTRELGVREWRRVDCVTARMGVGGPGSGRARMPDPPDRAAESLRQPLVSVVSLGGRFGQIEFACADPRRWAYVGHPPPTVLVEPLIVVWVFDLVFGSRALQCIYEYPKKKKHAVKKNSPCAKT
jgi:hypothetical protein